MEAVVEEASQYEQSAISVLSPRSSQIKSSMMNSKRD
jgi:hypothetical protein